MADEPADRKDLVLRPGGYSPKSSVHSVNPGQAVIQDKKGVRVMADSDLVLTPGGRDRSLVHLIEPKHALVVDEHEFSKLNLTTKAAKKIQDTIRANVPALGSGWVSYAFWNNGTGATLKSFNTTWIVPKSPAAEENPLQTIFLFNGVQNYGSNFGILQPVLQWGTSAAPGGGNFWAVTS